MFWNFGNNAYLRDPRAVWGVKRGSKILCRDHIDHTVRTTLLHPLFHMRTPRDQVLELCALTASAPRGLHNLMKAQANGQGLRAAVGDCRHGNFQQKPRTII